jgi:putative membrane protein
MPAVSPAYELLTGIACGGEAEARQPYGFPAVALRPVDIFSLPRPMLATAPQERAVYSQVWKVSMFHISSLLRSPVLTAIVCFAAASAMAQSAAKPTDPQIADIAYTAGQIDIAAANFALKKTHTQAVRYFAEQMIRDNTAVNNKVLALLDKLMVTPEANDMSKSLTEAASKKREELSELSGAAFEKAYVENEVAYHQTVNGALETTLIPSAQNGELKSLLETGLKLFQERGKLAKHILRELDELNEQNEQNERK